MAPLAEHLVGRGEELGSLVRILDELERGRPTALALVGEPGIGKTRLLRELGALAEQRRFLVLYGSASELERDLPFSVFVDALDEYVEGLDPRQLATLHEGVQAELAGVLPSLSTRGRADGVALQQERFRTHRAVRALLEHLARPRPLVLVLDDIHWADTASIESLSALLRRPPGAAVLVALALRPRQVPPRLSSALERAERAALMTWIRLGPLTSAEARQLLGGTVGDAHLDVLYEESGGNPFYLGQLARSLDHVQRAVSPPAMAPTAGSVPQAVAAALGEELELLSGRVRLILEGAAVAGDPFEPELAAAAAGTSEPSAMDAIDELLRFDLVRPTDVPRRFRFRHPLVRRAVYDAAPAGWRLRAHERCSRALAARGAAPAARAYHLERSAREGDLEAVAVLRAAAESAAPLAPASSARWLGDALRLLPQTAPPEERVTLLLARADSLAAIGQLDESRAELRHCVEIAPQDWRIRVTTACAAVEHVLGLRSEANRHLTSALAELGDEHSAEAVELMIELSVDGFYGADFDAMRDWAERAVAAATHLGDHALIGAAASVQAWGGALAGDGERAQAHCDEATELVDQLTDEEMAQRLDTLVHLTGADVWLDRYSAATRHARRALEICRRTGQGGQYPLVVQMLGVSLWVQGRTSESEELLDGAVDAARLAGNVHSLAWTLFNRSIAALAAGDLDTALATARESFELGETMEPGPISGATAATLASALLEVGQVDRSVDLLLTRVGGDELQFIPGGWRARFLEVLTRALLATGRRVDAERAAAATQACADAMSVPTAAAMASLAAANLAIDSGEPTAAAERALAAAAQFEAVGALWDAARAREVAGRALAQAGSNDRAVHELERAAAAFDSFGSVRYRDQAERELRKLGRHLHRRTRPGAPGMSGVESLTGRELQIARLVADRQTNTQIAAELYLSRKTVESHLRNIFNKVGVATRVDLARAVERGDSTMKAQLR